MVYLYNPQGAQLTRKYCGDIVNDRLPVIIRGDGNFLARCGSLLVYGNGRLHRDRGLE